MIIFTLVILTVSIFEIWELNKKGLKKNIFVFAGVMLLTAAMGYFYLWDTYRASFAQIVLNLLKVER